MLDLHAMQRTLADLIGQRLAANYTSRSAYEQAQIVGGLQEQITIMNRDEPATLQRISELRLIAEGATAADALQDVLDAVLVLKADAEAALAS